MEKLSSFHTTKRMKKSRIEKHHGAASEDVGMVIKHAVVNNMLSMSDIALFYDLEAFENSLYALQSAFPKDWRHCLAVKANPLLRMLEIAVQKGFGLECASIVEVELSIKAGCEPHKIVYDSPCKTVKELSRALELGIQINCDGFDEIQRIKQILQETKQEIEPKSIIGVRVNPLLGLGQIKALSVSDATSKFGIPLNMENRQEIIKLFKENMFLNALHVHVGSQGCSLEMLSSGAATIYQLAEEIGGPNRIKVLDIGGGLPTNFSSDETIPTFHAYAQVLKKIVPALFESNCQYICVTEFGRSMQAKLGWVASGCELVKIAGDRRIAVIHVGSDMFVRTCYCPADFPLRVQVVDGESFDLKTADKYELVEHNVVGPLCFGGDKICEAMKLPIIHTGDFVVVRDAGANCLSLWSRHCSRPSPAVYGYRRQGDSIEFTQLRKRETLENILQFWE